MTAKALAEAKHPLILLAEDGMRADDITRDGALAFFYGLEKLGLLRSEMRTKGKSTVRIFFPVKQASPSLSELMAEVEARKVKHIAKETKLEKYIERADENQADYEQEAEISRTLQDEDDWFLQILRKRQESREGK